MSSEGPRIFKAFGVKKVRRVEKLDFDRLNHFQQNFTKNLCMQYFHLVRSINRPSRYAILSFAREIKIIFFVVAVFTLQMNVKPFSSLLYPIPSLSYSSRQRNEFPWSQANNSK